MDVKVLHKIIPSYNNSYRTVTNDPLICCECILFYSILFYSILFYSILFYSILFYLLFNFIFSTFLSLSQQKKSLRALLRKSMKVQ